MSARLALSPELAATQTIPQNAQDQISSGAMPGLIKARDAIQDNLRALARAETRDEAARRIYRDLAGNVRRRLHSWCRGRLVAGEINELVDSAFTKLWLWVAQGNEPARIANLEYFLTATAQRLWLDQHRREARWQQVDLSQGGETIADHADDPEVGLIQRQRYARNMMALKAVLDELELRQPRPVLILRLHLDDWSNGEIARELGLKPESVRTSLGRTRAALLRRLAETR